MSFGKKKPHVGFSQRRRNRNITHKEQIKYICWFALFNQIPGYIKKIIRPLVYNVYFSCLWDQGFLWLPLGEPTAKRSPEDAAWSMAIQLHTRRDRRNCLCVSRK